MRLWAVLTVALAAGCTGDPVGDACTPEHVPAGGFDAAETYVEASSAECVTRVCLVRGLEGDPRPDCQSGCASASDVSAHVYCTCRCDPDGPAAPCACPSGTHCEDTGGAGSYCVRD